MDAVEFYGLLYPIEFRRLAVVQLRWVCSSSHTEALRTWRLLWRLRHLRAGIAAPPPLPPRLAWTAAPLLRIGYRGVAVHQAPAAGPIPLAFDAGRGGVDQCGAARLSSKRRKSRGCRPDHWAQVDVHDAVPQPPAIRNLARRDQANPHVNAGREEPRSAPKTEELSQCLSNPTCRA